MTRRLAGTFVVFVAICAAIAACGTGETDADPTDVPRNTATMTTVSSSDAAEPQPSKGFETLQQWESPPEMALESGVDYQARITTNLGEVVVDLFENEAPIAVNNFVFLAEQGFYENVPFHRVLSGFVIQSGDPTGTGRGGPGYRFQDEPISKEYAPGTLAMANAGPNTNGSQFFITLSDLSGQLPKNYTIFGEVLEGQDVVDAVAGVPVTVSESGERSKPTEAVFIRDVEILKK